MPDTSISMESQDHHLYYQLACAYKRKCFSSSLKAKVILTLKLTALKKTQRLHSKVQYNFLKYYQCHYSLAQSTNLLNFQAGVSKSSTKFSPTGNGLKWGWTQLSNVSKYTKEYLGFLTTWDDLRHKATKPTEWKEAGGCLPRCWGSRALREVETSLVWGGHQ